MSRCFFQALNCCLLFRLVINNSLLVHCYLRGRLIYNENDARIERHVDMLRMYSKLYNYTILAYS